MPVWLCCTHWWIPIHVCEVSKKPHRKLRKATHRVSLYSLSLLLQLAQMACAMHSRKRVQVSSSLKDITIETKDKGQQVETHQQVKSRGQLWRRTMR